MDLSTINFTDRATGGVAMQVEHPATGEPLTDEATGKPVTITLLGQDSPAYQAHIKTAADKRLRKAGAGRGLRLKIDEIEEEQLDLLCACTRDWAGLMWRGEYPACTPEAARMVYGACKWLREQATAFIQERGNYLGN